RRSRITNPNPRVRRLRAAEPRPPRRLVPHPSSCERTPRGAQPEPGDSGSRQKWKDDDVRARSVSAPLAPLFRGPLLQGVGLGSGHLDIEGMVLSLTAPGRPRMPNGVETDLVVERGEACWLGEGRLEAGGRAVLPGPVWDPVPTVLVRLSVDRRFTPDPERLAGRGGGLTPSGDDVLCGYVAGLVLWHGRAGDAASIATAAAE